MSKTRRTNYVYDDVPKELRDLAGEYLQMARCQEEDGDDEQMRGFLSMSIAASLLALVDYAARADKRAGGRDDPADDEHLARALGVPWPSDPEKEIDR